METIDDVPLGALRVFEAVAAHGGFAAAGRQLGLSRAAVSRIASHLETLVGVRLFRRTTRRVVLTDAATQLAERLAPSLPALRQALELASADEQHLAGPVRVSVSQAFGRRYVVPSIARFVALQPAVQPEIQFSDRIEDLVAVPIDVAVRMGPLPPSSMTARRLGRIATVVVAAPSLTATLDRGRSSARSSARPGRAPRWTPGALAALPAVMFRIPGTHDVVPWSVAHAKRLHAITPDRVAARSDSIEGVVDLARLGVGAAFVPHYLVEEDLARHRLEVLVEGAPAVWPEVHLCFLGRHLLAPRVRALVEHLGNDLGRALKPRGAPATP